MRSGQGFFLIWFDFCAELSPCLPYPFPHQQLTPETIRWADRVCQHTHTRVCVTCSVYMCIYICPLFLSTEVLAGSDTFIAWSIPGTQFFISRCRPPVKRCSFGEMANFRAGPEKVQCEPGTSCCARKQGNTQRMSEGHEPAWKASHWPVMIVTDYNSLNKIESHESIQI